MAASEQQQQRAIDLLKDTEFFGQANQGLLEALASKMELLEVENHHVFVEEDGPFDNVFVIEEGVLVRSKLSADDRDSLRSSIGSTENESVLDEKHSVVVDEISGRGRITGLHHNVGELSFAFATVYSKGPAKVWQLPGADFRDVASSKPEHALDVMQALCREATIGSKSLRNMIRKEMQTTSSGSGGSSGGDEASAAAPSCRILCYDTTSWVQENFVPAVAGFNEKEDQGGRIVMDFTSDRLSEKSAGYAAGYDAVCLFVNDTASAAVLRTLSLVGVRCVLMRCAGFDRVDTKAARAYGFTVARVPAYSPYAVAEFGISLLMTLNRKTHRASNRVGDGNFSLDSGLLGMDIHGKTVGVMGTGKIGQILCNILNGFGANIIAYDVYESDAVKNLGGKYVSKDEIFTQSDVIFLMMPLLPATHHTINDGVLPKLKKGVLLINTARGGLVNTKTLLRGIQDGTIGGVGMDVYENEGEYFFQDWSARTIKDPDLIALMGLNNVVLTAHQAFFTREAIDKIVGDTLQNAKMFAFEHKKGQNHPNNCIPNNK